MSILITMMISIYTFMLCIISINIIFFALLPFCSVSHTFMHINQQNSFIHYVDMHVIFIWEIFFIKIVKAKRRRTGWEVFLWMKYESAVFYTQMVDKDVDTFWNSHSCLSTSPKKFKLFHLGTDIEVYPDLFNPSHIFRWH